MTSFFQKIQATKYVGSTLWMFLDRFVGLLTGLFVGAAVARFLGASRFGVLNYAFALVTILSPLYLLGLNSILARDLVRCTSNKNTLLGSAFIAKLCGAILVFVSICLFVFSADEVSTEGFVLLVIAGGALLEPFQVIMSYNQASVAQGYTAKASIVSQLLRAVIQIYFITSLAPLIYFAWAMLFEKLIRSGFLILFYRLHVGSIFQWRFSSGVVKAMLKDSWPLLLSGIASVVFLKIDQLMLKGMTDSWNLGIYSAAVRVSELFYIVPGIIVPSLFPALVKAKGININLYKTRVSQLYSIFIVFSLLVIVAVVPLAKIIISVLFGVDYAMSSSILMVHVLALPFICFMRVAGHSLVVENKQIYLLLITIIAAAVNVGLNAFLIPSMRGMGAAVATVISYVIAGSLGFLLFKESRHVTVEQVRAIASTTPSQIREIYKTYTRKNEK